MFYNRTDIFICILLINISCQTKSSLDSINQHEPLKTSALSKLTPISLENTSFFKGNQAYTAIRGNNFYTGTYDYVITFSLNNKNGTLVNQQTTFVQTFQAQTPAPFNFVFPLQGQLPSNTQAETIAQIAWTVVNGTAYLAARGYNTNLGIYIATYTLNTKTGSLTNEERVYLNENESLNGMQWITVNNQAYLQTWGINTDYNQSILTTYALDATSNLLINPNTLFLPQSQSINQISWTVANNEAYLAIWGFNVSKNLYFVSIYTLDQVNNQLINQKQAYFNTTESVVQIAWVVIQNSTPIDIAYLAINGYESLSTAPFLTIFTLDETTGALTNKQKLLLLPQETCNQIVWVVVNNNAYLGTWGFDSLANNYYLCTYELSKTKGSLTNRQKIYTIFGEMINFISWVTVKNSALLDIAYLATRGYDNPRNQTFLGIYTFNEPKKLLTNLQLTFFEIQNTINQIEWVVSANKAYLGVIGRDNLNNKFYVSTLTLNPLAGQLTNRYTQLATSSETFYQFEWVAL